MYIVFLCIYLKKILVTKVRPELLHAWILLCKVYSKLHLYEEGLECILKIEKLMPSVKNKKELIVEKINLLKAEFLSENNSKENLLEAESLCLNVFYNLIL